MFALTTDDRFVLLTSPTDMRKGIDGLCGVVRELGMGDPEGEEVFIFINRSRDRMKLLHWASGGYVLYNKRLEAGRFQIPHYDGDVCLKLGYARLVMLVDGLSITNVERRKRHTKNSDK